MANAAEEEMKLLVRGDACGLGRGSCGGHVGLGFISAFESDCKRDVGVSRCR